MIWSKLTHEHLHSLSLNWYQAIHVLVSRHEPLLAKHRNSWTERTWARHYVEYLAATLFRQVSIDQGVELWRQTESPIVHAALELRFQAEMMDDPRDVFRPQIPAFRGKLGIKGATPNPPYEDCIADMKTRFNC